MSPAERSACPEPCGDPPCPGAAHKMAAGGRQRLLPAWMAAAEQPAAPAGPPPTAARRRRPQGQGRPVAARAATVYCMTEAELVDVALGVLAEKLQREEAREETWSASEEEQEQEQEQAPTPGSPASSAASTEEGGRCHPPRASPPHAGAEEPSGQDSEDDVLKYVREIFFS